VRDRSRLHSAGVLLHIALFVALSIGAACCQFSHSRALQEFSQLKNNVLFHTFDMPLSHFLSIGTADVIEVKSHVEPRPHILGNVHTS